MTSGYRSSAARDLVRQVQRAGGEVVRLSKGRLRVTGPSGSVTIRELGDETRRDLRRSSAAKLIEARTGLILSTGE